MAENLLAAAALDLPGIIAFLRPFLSDGIRKKVEEWRTKNPRAEAMRIIHKMEPLDRDRLLHKIGEVDETSDPVFENDLAVGLGEVIPRGKDGKLDEQAAKDFYEWVANLNDDQFSVFANFMVHNPLAQRFRYYLACAFAWAVENNSQLGEILIILEHGIKAALIKGLMVSFGVSTPLELRRKLKNKETALRNSIELHRGWDANGNNLMSLRAIKANKYSGFRALKGWVYRCMGW